MERGTGSVPAMDMHPGEQLVFEGHPSWRATLLFYFWGFVIVAVAAVVVALLASTVVAVLVAIAGVAAVVAVGFVKRMATRYVITSERLHIRRGVLTKRTQETRIQRVQNVNTDQRFFERVLQIGTVDFDTAGTDDSEFRFVGVSNPGDVVQAVDRAQREAAARSA
jgi:uncharacterized membrane protein YdbT with pleckstrin-like domain